MILHVVWAHALSERVCLKSREFCAGGATSTAGGAATLARNEAAGVRMLGLILEEPRRRRPPGADRRSEPDVRQRQHGPGLACALRRRAGFTHHWHTRTARQPTNPPRSTSSLRKSGVTRLTHTHPLSPAARAPGGPWSPLPLASQPHRQARLSRRAVRATASWSGPGAISAAIHPSVDRASCHRTLPVPDPDSAVHRHPPRRPAGSPRAALLLPGLVRAPDLELQTRHGT
jgi:hypothetical protein